MSEHPYVLLSCAASGDGYIDDATDERLLLSNDEDFDRVDEVRAGCDAILVGANTIRQDNPRLLVRSEARRAERISRGQSESPIKVTLTGCGNLNPDAKFFTAGDVDKIVYAASPVVGKSCERLGGPPSSSTPASRSTCGGSWRISRRAVFVACWSKAAEPSTPSSSPPDSPTRYTWSSRRSSSVIPLRLDLSDLAVSCTITATG